MDDRATDATPLARPKPLALERHGIRWDDEYAWLRDPNYPTVQDPAILSYLSAENVFFDQWRAQHGDRITQLTGEFRGRMAENDSGVPWRDGAYCYRWRFDEGAEFRRWERAPSDDPEQFEVFLDEPGLAKGLDYFQLGAWSIAPNNRLLAYTIDDSGSERYRLIVRGLDHSSGDSLWELANTIDTPLWSACSRYLFFLTLDSEWRPSQLRRLDLAHGHHHLVFEERDSGFRLSAAQSQSAELLLLNSSNHETAEVRWLPLATPLAALSLVAPRRAGHDYDLDHDGKGLVIRSNRQHENYGLYRSSLLNATEADWELLRSSNTDRYLTGHCAFSNLLVVTERWRGLDQIVLLESNGTSKAIAFPEASYSVDLAINAEPEVAQLRLSYSSMIQPHTIYDYDLASGELLLRKVQQIPSGYNATDYRTERLEFLVRDGTRVPVSLVYHRAFPPDADRPLLLYGYGAYGIAIEPSFSSSRLSLLNRGVSYAIAHIRGGDDLGYHWYKAGKLTQRTNTFNDFVDVARGLIDRALTSRGRIAFVGGSAGGELVGAALNQAPDLPGAAVLQVPFVDVLNTMLDDTLPLTPMEWPEWGNPIQDRAAFEHLLSYSPYDQLRKTAYPAMLVTAGLNDPRVTYWEAAKYVARCRDRRTDNRRLLLKTNMSAGHGGRSGRFDALEEMAEEYAFLLSELPGVQAL